MNTLFRHLRLLFSVVFALCMIVPSAKADTACAAGNLSALMGTTCDIGSLQFTFNELDGATPTGSAWTASDFTLTPVAGGFTISLNAGPQTITAASGKDAATLLYNVTDLDGDLTGTTVTGTATETGTGQFGDLDEAAITNGAAGYAVFGNFYSGVGFESGVPASVTLQNGSPFAYGYGEFRIFDLTVHDGSGYWGGSSTATFESVPTAATTPEPSSLALLGSGALLLGAEIRRRYRTIR